MDRSVRCAVDLKAVAYGRHLLLHVKKAIYGIILAGIYFVDVPPDIGSSLQVAGV